MATLAVIGLAGCARPEPPTITPVAVALNAVSPAGIACAVTVDATNPNGFPLMSRNVTATVTVGSQVLAGKVSAPTGVSIPAHGTTRLVVPLEAPWTDLVAVAGMALSPAGIPFQVDGVINIGADKLNVDLPFRVSGTIPQEQLLGLGLRGLRLPRMAPIPVQPR